MEAVTAGETAKIIFLWILAKPDAVGIGNDLILQYKRRFLTMRTFRQVYTSFWTSESVRVLSMEARHLALYLLTGPHTNMIGAFRIPILYICDDLDLPEKIIRSALGELASPYPIPSGNGSGTVPEPFRNGSETDAEQLQVGVETYSKYPQKTDSAFLTYDEKSRWLFIHNFLEFNKPCNPNMAKAMTDLLAEVPENLSFYNTLKEKIDVAVRPFKSNSETVSKQSRNGSATVPKPFRNTETETETETKTKSLPPPPPPRGG
ncbi:MAG: hypothetical protein HQL73_03635 [Magnetococcales bacterium]|nr:hypothetical protein [Magnetococcales bacterium]